MHCSSLRLPSLGSSFRKHWQCRSSDQCSNSSLLTFGMYDLGNLSEHPFLISKVWLIMPWVTICQGGPDVYASSPFVVPSCFYHSARGKLYKQQCNSSETKLQGTLASILASFIAHCGPSSGEGTSLEMLMSWRTHTWWQSPSEPRSRTSSHRSTSNMVEPADQLDFAGLHSLPIPVL